MVVIGLLATGPLSLATALARKTSAARSLLLAVAATGVVVVLAAALLLLVFAVECGEGSRCFG